MTVAYRHATEADHQFIVSTWSSTYKSSRYAGILWTDDYAPVMHTQIRRVLARPEAVAIVACDEQDHGFLFGHLVGEVDEGQTPILHYVYVKAPYRRSGIARGLFEAAGIKPANYFVYTCLAFISADEDFDRDRFLAEKIPRGRFDPNGIRYSKQNRRRAL